MLRRICIYCDELYLPTGKRQRICLSCREKNKGGRPTNSKIKMSKTIGMCHTGGIKNVI